MKLNKMYGRLVDGKLCFAPAVLITDHGILVKPKLRDYLAEHWYPILNLLKPRRKPPEGKIWRDMGYEQLENAIRHIWILVDEQQPEPVYRTFSKLKMVIALEKAGIWDQIKSWIEANNLYDKYLAAQNFGEDNEYFKIGLQTLQDKLGWTDEQVENLLNSCVID